MSSIQATPKIVLWCQDAEQHKTLGVRGFHRYSKTQQPVWKMLLEFCKFFPIMKRVISWNSAPDMKLMSLYQFLHFTKVSKKPIASIYTMLILYRTSLTRQNSGIDIEQNEGGHVSACSGVMTCSSLESRRTSS